VADPGQPNNDHKLRQLRTTGQFEGNLGVSSLDNPRGVGIDDDDRIWVVDATGTGQVFRYNQNGGTNPTIFDPSGSGSLASPQGIALFRDKNSNNDLFVYVADTGNQRVVKFRYVSDSNNGLEFVTAAGESGAGSKNFNQPTGIGVDSCGNVYVADRINNRIQQLDKDLNFKSSITSSLNRPTGVVIPPNADLLYIVDSENNRIVCLTLSK
jgi:sugar lactone lactonase YvrE